MLNLYDERFEVQPEEANVIWALVDGVRDGGGGSLGRWETKCIYFLKKMWENVVFWIYAPWILHVGAVLRDGGAVLYLKHAAGPKSLNLIFIRDLN